MEHMKNVLVHINPQKQFTSRFGENDTMIKIQIDNSLELGWEPGNILLVTNFPYEYRGVKAMEVDDGLFCPFRPLSTKTCVVAYLLYRGILEDAAWVHDFDAFQMETLDPEFDFAGMTDYGWSSKWSLGSYFVTPEAKDLFTRIKDTIYRYQEEDERALVRLTREGMAPGITKLNITYNFGMRHVEENYQRADKPIKVAHFHPGYQEKGMKYSTTEVFVHGKNGLNQPLVTDRFARLLQKYGIK